MLFLLNCVSLENNRSIFLFAILRYDIFYHSRKGSAHILCQKETGVLSGSEIFFGSISNQTRGLLYYVDACGHYCCELGYKIRRRNLEAIILMLIENGTMRLQYEGKSYTAGPGDVVLIDCNHPQYYDTPDYLEFYWLHIGGVNAFDFCDYLTRERGIVHRTAHNEHIATLIRYLVSQFTTNQPVSDAEHSRILHSILCYLMPGAPVAFDASDDNSPVQQVIRFIQLHLSEDLNLNRLSQVVHLSPSHLIRLFRAEIHHSPHEYIILTRMNRARYLLKTTSMPIKAIALESGYRNESSFTSAFTEKIGISPHKFRDLPFG